MKVILGTKEKMTQIFAEDGKVYPVTAINTGTVVVTQIKNKDKDGYEAVQIGFDERKVKNINKAQQGHFKGLGNFRYIKEFRLPIPAELKVGDKIDLNNFEKGDKIQISSFSKGKGFAGVVKRHHFAGGRRTHGQKHSEREAGSIGGSGGRAGGRVAKGIRMAGRMGNDRVTLKKVEIIALDKENNKIFVKGAVPGRRGTLIEIQG